MTHSATSLCPIRLLKFPQVYVRQHCYCSQPFHSVNNTIFELQDIYYTAAVIKCLSGLFSGKTPHQPSTKKTPSSAIVEILNSTYYFHLDKSLTIQCNFTFSQQQRQFKTSLLFSPSLPSGFSDSFSCATTAGSEESPVDLGEPHKTPKSKHHHFLIHSSDIVPWMGPVPANLGVDRGAQILGLRRKGGPPPPLTCCQKKPSHTTIPFFTPCLQSPLLFVHHRLLTRCYLDSM